MSESQGDGTVARTQDRSWRITVVDDAVLNADSMSDVLRALGHQVFTAYDGLSALASHTHFAPDAYLLDLSMPGLSGFNTCRALRLLPRGDLLSIVALSGWARNEDIANALEAGFSGFLLKPASPNEVLTCLSTCSRT